MNRTWSLIALAATAAALSACGDGDSDKAGGEDPAETTVLTLANPDDGPFDLDEYAQEVERASEGTLEIEFKNYWRRGDPENELGAIEDVRDGEVDMASIGTQTFDLVGVDSLRPLRAPFAVDSYALQREVLASPLADEMLTGVEEAGVVPIALLPGAMRRPLGVSGPLYDASDYRGATIGIRPSELSTATFEALGAETTGYHFDDPITNFDGMEVQSISVAFSEGGDPAQSYATNVNLWPRALTIVMNEDAYAALDDSQQEALRSAGAAALDPSLDDIQHRDGEAIGLLCNAGNTAVRALGPAQLEEIQSATRVVVDELSRDPANREALEQIAAMRESVEPEPTPGCDDDQQETATSGPTPFDGLWRMETTKDEAATVVPRADLIPENYGEFTFAFKDGRFAFTTESEGACIWAYGSYSVDGDTVEWRIEDGGGETPQDAANQPGEVFVYSWSRYRDQLTIEAIPGEISPEPYRVEPWRLLPGEVTLDPLSDRCPPPADALDG